MKRVIYLLASLLVLVACTEPVVTSRRTVTQDDNELRITSGTWNKGRFILVETAKIGWEADLAGGKEQWSARREFLYSVARDDIRDICGDTFFAVPKRPVYNMLDNDETMGGIAPVLGVAASMVAYLAAEAKTKDENIPVSLYIEFNCMEDEQGTGK